MSHDTPTIVAQLRTQLGTIYANRLRRDGRLPAVIYGREAEPAHVSVDEKEVTHYLRHGSHVMTVETEGKGETCLVKDLQFGYLGDNLIHVDFARVDLDQIVTVTIQLELSGSPALSKEAGAVLEIVRPEIEVECMVKDIPSSIKGDLSKVEEAFTIGDLDMPPGVTAILDSERHVAHIAIKAEEEEEVLDVEGVEVGEAQTPEVIGDSADESSDEPTPEASGSEGE